MCWGYEQRWHHPRFVICVTSFWCFWCILGNVCAGRACPLGGRLFFCGTLQTEVAIHQSLTISNALFNVCLFPFSYNKSCEQCHMYTQQSIWDKTNQIELSGHQITMHPRCLPVEVLWGCPSGKRSWGRTGTHWRDFISHLACKCFMMSPGGAGWCGWRGCP